MTTNSPERIAAKKTTLEILRLEDTFDAKVSQLAGLLDVTSDSCRSDKPMRHTLWACGDLLNECDTSFRELLALFKLTLEGIEKPQGKSEEVQS